MMNVQKIVGAFPSHLPAQTNYCALVCPRDFNNSIKYVEVHSEKGAFIFLINRLEEVPTGVIWLNKKQRKWAILSPGQVVNTHTSGDGKLPILANIVLEAQVYKKQTTLEPYDSDSMAREFVGQFRNRMISVGERLVFSFQDKKPLVLIVKDLKRVIAFPTFNNNYDEDLQAYSGVCNPFAEINFIKTEGSTLNLIEKGHQYNHPSITQRDGNFQNMGVGGLDDKLEEIFRLAFLPRLFPDIYMVAHMKHIKGILLYGPPGVGKTLMAHQIAKMWNSREPKIVNGHDLFAKHVRDAEADIRNLFVEAEEEEKQFGRYSGLHIIIFDDIDAICKERGSVGGAKQTSLVLQFSPLLDGVKQRNNLLVIGTTNKKDSIFYGLLRHGRMGDHIEIGLPNESARAEILKIHTAKLRENNMLGDDVDIMDLARKTEGYTGADIKALVLAAESRARINGEIETCLEDLIQKFNN